MRVHFNKSKNSTMVALFSEHSDKRLFVMYGNNMADKAWFVNANTGAMRDVDFDKAIKYVFKIAGKQGFETVRYEG